MSARTGRRGLGSRVTGSSLALRVSMALALGSAALVPGASAALAAPVSVSGGASASTATDITSEVLANHDIALTGGHYVVRVPTSGPGVITAAQAETTAGYRVTDAGAGHFVAPTAPSILYTGVISGTGAVEVTNATSSTNPPASGSFSGGMLMITAGQTYRNGGNVGMTIDPNTAVAFVKQGNLGTRGTTNHTATDHPLVNIVNNGYLYSWNTRSREDENQWGSIESTLPGAGVVTFESGNRFNDGSHYSGSVYILNGSHTSPGALFDPGLKMVQSNILSYETLGENHLTSYGADAPPPAFRSVFGGNLYNFGVDTQIQGRGTQVFSGESFVGTGSASKKDLLPADQARKFSYFGLLGGTRGQVFYIQSTMQMGDGRSIVNYGDGTNNTFLQSNIAGTAGALQIGQFQGAPGSAADVLRNESIAFNYSGTYPYDAGVNAGITATGMITPHRPDHGNLILVNPDPQNTGKAPNHLVLTSPLLIHGVTNIQRNTILELGDGTAGNSSTKSVTVGGRTYTGNYSSSYGNGMILTKLNSPTQWPTADIKVTGLTAAFDVINNNGKIIVNNVPDALSIKNADPSIATWIGANLLDNITGVGGVVQTGTLALTLAGTNTYTGGTVVDAGSTLKVASAGALGAASGSGTGSVVNHGTLQASGSNHVITVPGNYDQTR